MEGALLTSRPELRLAVSWIAPVGSAASQGPRPGRGTVRRDMRTPQQDDDELATVQGGEGVVSGPAPLFVLRVASGKDTGRSLVLDWNARPRVLVGQSRVCDLVLVDPRVSRRH